MVFAMYSLTPWFSGLVLSSHVSISSPRFDSLLGQDLFCYFVPVTGIISIHPYLNTNHRHNHVPWSTRGREAVPIWEPFRNRNSLGNLGYVTQCSGTFIKRCRNKTTSKHHSAVYCQSVKPFSFLGTSKPLLNSKNQ